MKTYTVAVREVWVQLVKVEAEDIKEAVDKVVSGEGEYLDDCLDYSHTLGREYFTVDPET